MVITTSLIGAASWYSGQFARALNAIGTERVVLAGITHLGADDQTLKRLTGRTAGEFASQFGTRAYDSAEELLQATRPDLVLVASPNTEKARHVELAVASGADVFVAKPMAATLADAARLRDAARRHPGQLVGALNPARFATAIRDAQRRVAAGEIGDPLTARAWIQHGAADPANSRTGSPESDDQQGGPAFGLGVYAADLLNWFLGASRHPATSTYAVEDNLNTGIDRESGRYPWMDTAKGVVRYAEGRVGSMDIVYSVPMPAPLWEIEVTGRDGMLRTNGGNYEGMIWRRAGTDRARVEPFAPTVDDTILATLRHVVACCERREPFEMDAEDGYRAIELCVAWQQSSLSGQAVALPLEGHDPPTP
jgi:predicted dehydrogenase